MNNEKVFNVFFVIVAFLAVASLIIGGIIAAHFLGKVW